MLRRRNPRPTPTEGTGNGRPPRRLILSRRAMPFQINGPLLLLVVGLALLAVILVFDNLGLFTAGGLVWLPAALSALAVVWFVRALLRRSGKAMLRSSALLGLSLSLLLAAQGLAPVGGTLVGLTLICVGAGLLLRGLLLRQV